MIDLHLTTVRKYRSKHEYRPQNSVSCTLPDGTILEEVGDHAIIVAICAKIEGSGYSDDVRVLRDGVVAILPLYSGLWARKHHSARQVDKQQ
jgi:hypothetical protein